MNVFLFHAFYQSRKFWLEISDFMYPCIYQNNCDLLLGVAMGVLGNAVRLGYTPMLEIGDGPPCQVPPMQRKGVVMGQFTKFMMV